MLYTSQVVGWDFWTINNIYPLFWSGCWISSQLSISWAWTWEVLVIPRGEKRVKNSSSKNHRKDFKENTMQVHLSFNFPDIIQIFILGMILATHFFLAQTTKKMGTYWHRKTNKPNVYMFQKKHGNGGVLPGVQPTFQRKLSSFRPPPNHQTSSSHSMIRSQARSSNDRSSGSLAAPPAHRERDTWVDGNQKSGVKTKTSWGWGWSFIYPIHL